MIDFFQIKNSVGGDRLTLSTEKPRYATAQAHGFENVRNNFTDFRASLYTVLPSSPNDVLFTSNL
jgi:hypothetical protein